jgi:hypothetical protein
MQYRYYLSCALLKGEAERTGAVCRVPAAALEAVVIGSVRPHLKLPAAMDDYSLIETHIARVEVHVVGLRGLELHARYCDPPSLAPPPVLGCA